MATTNTTTPTFTLTLTEDERTNLLRFLEEGLRYKSVEANRTEAIEYHEFIHHQEEVYKQLIEKLRRQ